MADVPVSLAFSLEPTTDPLGAHLTVAVPDAPSEESRQALLDGMEESLVGAEGNLVFQAVQDAHDRLERYGRTHDYHTDSIAASFGGVTVDRSPTALDISWQWDHEAAMYMEFGTSDHTVEGDNLLVFEFDAAEYPYLDEMFPDGTAFLPEVSVSGLPEGRWLRDSLNQFRREVGQR
jgi:hypothetical protein